MKTRIKLSGGFHNSPSLSMIVETTFLPHPAIDTLSELLTEAQYKRASKHFCGLKWCMCGGISRFVTFEVLEG